MQTFRVILIEDDPMVREVNRQFIERVPGFELVAMAKNGKEGLELIETHQPNLVLMDIFMPELDGLQTFKEIRNKNFNIDVITVTAANDMATIQQILHLGVFDYIIKPFTFERMEQTLLNYKQFKLHTMNAEDLTQQELDLIMQRQIVNTKKSEKKHVLDDEFPLPKGLNRATLEKVLQFIEEKPEGVSAEEVAQAIGVARVTARRYLDFMEKQKLIEMESVYGNVGRPINKYFLI